MKAKNVTRQQLEAALQNVNEKHGFSLIWNREPELHGRSYHFTLRSFRSKIKGASVSFSGRNSCAASWEAHGFFFDELAALAPDCVIHTARATYSPGNRLWEDFNIGSQMQPMMASDNAYTGGYTKGERAIVEAVKG